MSDLKRYFITPTGPSDACEEWEDKRGEWVRYADHETEVRLLNAAWNECSADRHRLRLEVRELDDKVERAKLNSELQSRLAREALHKVADLEAEIQTLRKELTELRQHASDLHNEIIRARYPTPP